MTIEARIYIDGEPVYGRVVDIFPAPPERGGYILIVDTSDLPDGVGQIRKVWFPDPADAEVAAAAEVAENFRKEEDRIRTESQKAVQRLTQAQAEARRRKAARLRDAEAIPEVTE